MTPLAVPTSVASAGDRLEVTRAWPGRVAPGAAQLVLEGTDGAGRVRAARLDLAHRDEGWQPGRVRIAPAGRDERLPDLAQAASGGTVVVHRYGRRAVVRHPDRFVKVVRSGRGDQIAERAAQGHDLAARAGLTAPAVLWTADGRVDFSVLPGRSLHDLGRAADDAQWRSWWQTWAERWPDLAAAADGELRGPAGLPAYRAEDEQDTLRGWVERTLALGVLPDGDRLRRALDKALAGLGAGSRGPLVVSHRDLHDKQLLADDDSLGLLDFDTAALAEPALDLANLAVHARLRADQGWWPADRARVVLDAVGSVVRAMSVDEERLAAYAAATRLRLACVYAFRPPYAGLAAAWAGSLDENSLTEVSSPLQITRGG